MRCTTATRAAGLEVTGPSVLVRKGYKDKVSVWANYYVDMISSASIDVMATASPYKEERTEKSVGVDFLHGKTNMGLSYTNSEESDYSANSFRFGISQDFFGDLTTIGISYAVGADTVRRNGDDTFEEDADRQIYRVDLSQILTKRLIVAANYEGVTDEGFLNNPYRQVRYLDDSAPLGYSYQPEIYPNTRTSSAFAVRGMYYLPYRASARAEYRLYTDSWGIDAYNVEVGYTQPLWGPVDVRGQIPVLRSDRCGLLQRSVRPPERAEFPRPRQRARNLHHAYDWWRCELRVRA